MLAADGKIEIYGMLFRPTNFDPNKKYPIINNAYPGPQSSGHGYAPANYVMRRRWDYFVKYLLDAEPPNNYVIPSAPGGGGREDGGQ